jgi:membrane associated rhomboid family serine protease/Zn-finger nucleic acid-binding protein
VFWHCTECGGRAASLGFLRKAVVPSNVEEMSRSVRAKAGRDGRPCPSCERKMTEIEIPSSRGAEKIDVCKSCKCAWFDAREFEAFAEPREVVTVYEEVEAPTESADDWVGAMLGCPIYAQESRRGEGPVVTLVTAIALIAIAAFGIATLIVGADVMFDTLGLVPATWKESYGLTILASFFIHANVVHLASNAYFFFLVGPSAEDLLGRWRFLALLLLSHVAGCVVEILIDPSSTVPSIGASGGIAGLMAFFALKYPLAKLDGLIFWYGFWRIPAIAAFLLWFVLQVPILLDQLSGVGHVSGVAHLSGAIVGVLFWLRYRRA